MLTPQMKLALEKEVNYLYADKDPNWLLANREFWNHLYDYIAKCTKQLQTCKTCVTSESNPPTT